MSPRPLPLAARAMHSEVTRREKVIFTFPYADGTTGSVPRVNVLPDGTATGIVELYIDVDRIFATYAAKALSSKRGKVRLTKGMVRLVVRDRIHTPPTNGDPTP